MAAWESFAALILLLLAALLLGALFERFRQSAILGYLLAGVTLGPHALGLFEGGEEVEALAELGVALLLFSIGLEFSIGRLVALGRPVAVGGALQVVLTLGAAAGAAAALGVGVRLATAIGAMIALSSTACVLPLLTQRAELDSVHGRLSLGTLLLQDIAIVPLVLLVAALGGGGSSGEVATALLRAALVAAGLVVLFLLLFRKVVAPFFGSRAMRHNRELPTLLALVVGGGSAVVAHEMGLSPALGAFLAGLLLAETPFATQVRADVLPLRTVLMTLFFTSAGMLVDPDWIASNPLRLISLVALIVAGKALVAALSFRLAGFDRNNALAAGLSIAQVGEFSFVLIATARGRLIGEDAAMLLLSAAVATLFLTPFLVRFAGSRRLTMPIAVEAPEGGIPARDHVVIVGFGPAGYAVAEALSEQPGSIVVIDLNPEVPARVRSLGATGVVGSAESHEVLEKAHAAQAAAIIVTVPDPAAARRIVTLARSVAPGATVVVRSRYHVYRASLESAGADVVVDEEVEVGAALAAAARQAGRVS